MIVAAGTETVQKRSVSILLQYFGDMQIDRDGVGVVSWLTMTYQRPHLKSGIAVQGSHRHDEMQVDRQERSETERNQRVPRRWLFTVLRATAEGSDVGEVAVQTAASSLGDRDNDDCQVVQKTLEERETSSVATVK